MDVGSAVYTEFDTSPDIANYMVMNDLMDCHMGLVHSHQSFGTFFSSTDTSTLQEEGSYKNNFVSLIVNNAGSYTAAITRHVFCEVENNTTYTYEMFGDGTKSGSEKGTEKRERIEYFMMNVHKPELPENTLDTRIDEILEKKRKSTAKYSPYSNQTAVYNTTPFFEAYDDEPFYSGDKKDKPKSDRGHIQMDIPWEEEEFKGKSKPADITVNKYALKITMARLLTSSMICNVDTIDIDSWITNYDNAYEIKFKDLVDYSEWLAPYLEYLMTHIPGTPQDVVDDRIVAVYANEIIKKIISKIGKPKGKYITELIDQLRFYGDA